MSKEHLRPGPNGGGRRAGARNKLQTSLLEALAEDFAENGIGAVRICRVERPAEYLKICVSVLPKELIVEAGVLADLSDEQIAGYIGVLQQMQTKNAASTAADDDTRH